MPERPSVEASQPEHKEHEPKINYHFLYSPHETARDFKNFKESFEGADIYVPEQPEWSPEIEAIYNNVSRGKIAVKDLMAERGSALRRECEVMYGSKKPILLADVSARSKEWSEKKEDLEMMYNAIKITFGSGKFDKYIIACREYIKTYAELLLARENRIKENLKRRVEKFIQDNPRYAKKDETRVLINLGMAHTAPYHKLFRAGEPVSREFGRPLVVFPSFEEAVRRVMFKKECPDELAAKIMVEEILYKALQKISKDTIKVWRAVRKLAADLTLEDIEKLSKIFAEKSWGTLPQVFKKVGIELPKNEKEINNLIN